MMWNPTAKLFLRAGLAACLLHCAESVELPVRMQYPTEISEILLTGVTDGEVEFRPKGRDTGGRAYIEIETLIDQGVTFAFMFPAEFYEAVGQLKRGSLERALPIIRREARPFLDIMELSVLPGNHLPAVYAYMDALQATKNWAEAVEVALKFPLASAPPGALQRVGRLALKLKEAGQADRLRQLHAHIEAPADYSLQHLEQLMDLANQWRESGAYTYAYKLYLKVQMREGPLQTRARLWVGYCSFYLDDATVSERFLSNLPEVEFETPDYSLRELIQARLRMREEEYDRAMRNAAAGKTYASPTDSWYPELLFLLANLYADFEMEAAAEATHRELSILFPSSQWAQQSLQILENEPQ